MLRCGRRRRRIKSLQIRRLCGFLWCRRSRISRGCGQVWPASRWCRPDQGLMCFGSVVVAAEIFSVSARGSVGFCRSFVAGAGSPPSVLESNGAWVQGWWFEVADPAWLHRRRRLELRIRDRESMGYFPVNAPQRQRPADHGGDLLRLSKPCLAMVCSRSSGKMVPLVNRRRPGVGGWS